ncbi:MAG: biotin--[acetyl-CoA-carboxylase] ligase [Verrucomicrobiaceae bacterium]|nr:biotin--[acetyl-CoA-carboxylase] ligase [Verrucomicrobiaceae bacterium]
MRAEVIESQAAGWRVQCYDEVGSTNDLAREAGAAGAEWLAIFAESQTAGRGQRSNRWVTPKGRDLMFSIVLRPHEPLEFWPRFTTLAALAVCKGIEAMLPLKPEIKWPNDIYLGSRKVCGLLAETSLSATGSFLVLGIGLNVNATTFAPELEDSAISLLKALPPTLREIDRESLAAAVLVELRQAFALCEHDYAAALAEVRERSLLIGKTIRARVNESVVHGRVLDLNHEGHLVLQLADGSVTHLSSAAEVRW